APWHRSRRARRARRGAPRSSSSVRPTPSSAARPRARSKGWHALPLRLGPRERVPRWLSSLHALRAQVLALVAHARSAAGVEAQKADQGDEKRQTREVDRLDPIGLRLAILLE